MAAQQRALRLAESLNHPFSIGWALAFRFMIDMFNRDPAAALEAADKTIAYCTEQAYLFWLFAAMIVRGWALSLLENPEEGIALIEKGLDGWQAIGSIIVRPIFLGLFGEAKALGGDLSGAIETVEEGIQIARLHDELLSRLYLARIKGELLHKCGQGWRCGDAPSRYSGVVPETGRPILCVGCRRWARQTCKEIPAADRTAERVFREFSAHTQRDSKIHLSGGH